jgi:hypothetical protein
MTTMTTMENNETQVSADTANQTQLQTPQTKPKLALQVELSTNSVHQPLNQTQNQEEPAVAKEEEEPTITNTTEGHSPLFVSPSFAPQVTLPTGEELPLTPTPTPEPTPIPEPEEPAVAEEEEDFQAAVEICDNTLDDDDDGMVDTEDTEDCPIAETPEEHQGNGDNMPFVLPFDSQDVISAN